MKEVIITKERSEGDTLREGAILFRGEELVTSLVVDEITSKKIIVTNGYNLIIRDMEED